MPSWLFYLNSLDQSISSLRGQILLLPCFIEMFVINANGKDPDQMPHSAVSELCLHCLLMSHSWDAKHKWVNPCSAK